MCPSGFKKGLGPSISVSTKDRRDGEGLITCSEGLRTVETFNYWYLIFSQAQVSSQAGFEDSTG